MQIEECLKGLIGLTPRVKDCLPEVPEGVDVTISSSGLYLDQLVSTTLKLPVDNCGNDIWKLMLDSVNMATLQVQNDLVTYLATKFRSRITERSIDVGQAGKMGRALVGQQNAGFTIKTKAITGAQIVLEKLGLLVSQAATINVQVLKNGNIIKVLQLNPTANSEQLFDLKGNRIIMDVDGSDYTFQYVVPPGLSPISTPQSCNCTNKEAGLNELLRERFEGEAFGIMLKLRPVCNYMSLICPLTYTDATRSLVANAILYRSAFNLLNTIREMGTERINFYSLVDAEDFIGRIGLYDSAYTAHIEKIADIAKTSADIDACYTCKTSLGFSFKQIRL